jgi:hypothetical protein
LNKTEFLKWILSLPDNIDIFKCQEDESNCINVKIFTEPKGDEFYKGYFEP